MKKTLIILTVLLVAAFAVFAETITDPDQTVTLTSTILPKTDFAYVLGYSASAGSYTPWTSDPEIGVDPASDGQYYFNVVLGDKVNLGEGVTSSHSLDIDVTDFILNLEAGGQMASPNDNQFNNVTVSTPVTTLSSLSANDVDEKVVVTPVAATNNATSVSQSTSVNLVYSQGVTSAATELFTFNVEWTGHENLEAGTYTSTVTLSYTAG